MREPTISCGITAGYKTRETNWARAQTEVAAYVDIHGRNIVNRAHRRQEQGKETAHEDKKNSGEIAYSEPENGERDPGQRRDGAKDLHQGVKGHFASPVPAKGETERNGKESGQGKAPRHTKQRRNHILQQQPVLKQLADGFDYGPRARQELIWMPADSDLPENEQRDNKRDGAEPD